MSDTALNLEQKIEEGYIGVPTDLEAYVGAIATAATVLRPAGKIKTESGDTVDAVSTGEFIEAGTQVKVVKYENTQLYVEKV